MTLPCLLDTNLRSEGLVARDIGGVIQGYLVVCFMRMSAFIKGEERSKYLVH